MSHQAEAEENLRVIRSLMEKATVYRAISAPGAFFGGLAASVAAVVGITHLESHDDFGFVRAWVAVAMVTAGVNFFLLWRDATRRGDSFVSPGMRLAVRAMLPAILVGVLCTFVVGPCVQLASLWVLLYGTSLLAASHFAPKSICWLGRAFFVTGGALILVQTAVTALDSFWHNPGIANGIMGATFGLFHLAYAASTWPAKGSPSGAGPKK